MTDSDPSEMTLLCVGFWHTRGLTAFRSAATALAMSSFSLADGSNVVTSSASGAPLRAASASAILERARDPVVQQNRQENRTRVGVEIQLLFAAEQGHDATQTGLLAFTRTHMLVPRSRLAHRRSALRRRSRTRVGRGRPPRRMSRRCLSGCPRRLSSRPTSLPERRGVEQRSRSNDARSVRRVKERNVRLLLFRSKML